MICRIIARYRARKHTTFESTERLFVLLIVFEEYSGLAYKHRALFHDTHWTDCIGLSFGSFFTIFFVYSTTNPSLPPSRSLLCKGPP